MRERREHERRSRDFVIGGALLTAGFLLFTNVIDADADEAPDS